MPDAADPRPRHARKGWHFVPPLPLRLAPYWAWPTQPVPIVKYVLCSWRPSGTRLIFFLAALIAWTWFTPDLDRAQTVSLDWIGEVWLRNFVILTVVAGGLHLVLHRGRVQGDAYRYSLRPMAKGNKVFHFGNQVYDNMFWSFVALQFWTFWECLMWWAYANGWASMITLESNPVWFVVLTLLVPLWAGFHFYWFHRLLHVGKLYTWVHAWHHKNIHTGPWSGLAMHPVESFFLMFDTMIFFLISAHPIHVLFLLFHHGIGAPTSHAGFERLTVGGRYGIALGDYFHQLHHKFFDCNYGTDETPWDVWFETYHDGTAQSDAAMKERRRRLWANL